MSVTVHGTPGWRLSESGGAKYGSDARRGAFHERQVARAMEQWLTARLDHFDLFRDVAGFHQVRGAGLKPRILGTANIGHVMLTCGSRLVIDAEGCGDRCLGLSSERAGQPLEGR
ncbi:hypothetical protein [Streptosporangium canum]|uniref:hypothetical protein n=1 Tax=Streptosporangium canum TaxID=324952 RepID=UPI0037A6BC24